MNKSAQALGRLGGLATSKAKSIANRKRIKKFWADVRSGRKPFPSRKYTSLGLAERFWSKVNKGKPNDCWNWMASVDGGGYGKIGGEPPERKTIRASRVSWILNIGKIPNGKYVCHTCDNPLCVNPSHLYLGDAKTNMDDRTNRGRTPVGSRLPQAKLNEDQVREIKRTRGKVRFGASNSTVSLILSGKQWKHVTV